MLLDKSSSAAFMLDRVRSALYCEFAGCCWPQNQILRCNVELRNEGTHVHHEWAEVLDHPLTPEIEGCKAGGVPGALAGLRVRLGVQRWPDGAEVYIHAKLSDTLREIMGHEAKALGDELLPPDALAPLDFLRNRRGQGSRTPRSDYAPATAPGVRIQPCRIQPLSHAQRGSAARGYTHQSASRRMLRGPEGWTLRLEHRSVPSGTADD